MDALLGQVQVHPFSLAQNGGQQVGTIKTEKSEISLTKNEMLILQHLFNNRGHIVSRDSLMTILWNNAEYINENALTVNVSRIRSKLSELGYEDVIETRKGQGYILV